MSGIAQVLLNLGYQVSGSDLKRSAVTRLLQKRGAKIFFGHERSHVAGAHVVVTSSAVNSVNPEVKEAQKENIPVIARAEMLAELMRMKYSIAIGGTHGKTTTTSMIGQVLTEAGLDPTLVIGGRVNNLRSNARLGKGEYLVAEADESDRSFLKLTPTIAVITNIDLEHMENYRDEKHLRESFSLFANKVPFYGAVVACQDHPGVRSILPGIDRRLVTYGLKNKADYMAKGLVQEKTRMKFSVTFRGKEIGEASISVPGEHQVSNALATIAACRELDIPFSKIFKGLSRLKGVQRRFEILAKLPQDIWVVDDYGHHPVEIAATLEAARKGWPDHRCVVVVQPHRYSRLQNLWTDFSKGFQKMDTLVLLPVYAAGEEPIPGIHSAKMFSEIQKKRKTETTFYAENELEMKAILKSQLAPKTLFLFLGAGSITRYARNFAKGLKHV